VVIDVDKEMEVEEIKTKPHKQLVVCQYSEGNTEEQCKEAARLLALPDLELGMYTLCVFTVHHADKFQTDVHWVFYLLTLFPNVHQVFYLTCENHIL
jgi:hypothetical protein